MNHGTDSGYCYFKCRCAECTEAHRLKGVRDRLNRKNRTPPVHGRASTYKNWACRCEPCRKANTDQLREWRNRK